MKRFLKRLRFFYEQKTLRIAISVFALFALGFFAVAAFYIGTGTREYAGTKDRNYSIAMAQHGFAGRSEFENFIQRDAQALRNSRELRLFHEGAKPLGLLESTTPSPKKIQAFFAIANQKPNESLGLLSESECDQFSNDLQVTVGHLVNYASTLESKTNFLEKLKAFEVACKLSAPMTGRYSFVSYQLRVKSGLVILDALMELRRSDAEPSAKKQILDACVPILAKTFAFDIVLKKEELRILDAFAITLGDLPYDQISINYIRPKPFDAWHNILHKLPNVNDALISRTYQSFEAPTVALGKVKSQDIKGNPIGPVASAMMTYQFELSKDRSCSDLISHFSPDLISPKTVDNINHYTAKLNYLGFQEEY